MRWLGSTFKRRSFITNIGAAGAAALTGASRLQAQSSRVLAWRPTREAKDDWLDRIPGKHRMLFDSSMPESFASALVFAGNYYIANKDGYGLKDADLAVVIVARHFSTPFAFTDAIWAKYGATINRLSGITDPVTKQTPTNNIHMASLDPLLQRGTHLAVCDMATRQLADSIANDFGGGGESIYGELKANLVKNSHMVAAGIVAVNRAQERGYAFVNA
jgi:hypothetical protein